MFRFDWSMNFKFLSITTNIKTGPIPVVYSQKNSCPSVCPLKKHGCYAEMGHINIFWSRLNKIGLSFGELLSKIKDLPALTFWRYGVAGDLPGIGNRINILQLKQLIAANEGKRAFSYTHKPVLFGQASKKIILLNRKIIRLANKLGFAINLSANNLQHADKLKKLNIGPVATLLPYDITDRTLYTPAGNKVIVCPAMYKEGVTCLSCQLCSKTTRSCIVGFLAHGVSKKNVSKIAKNEMLS